MVGSERRWGGLLEEARMWFSVLCKKRPTGERERIAILDSKGKRILAYGLYFSPSFFSHSEGEFRWAITRLTRLGKRAGWDIGDVHNSHWGPRFRWVRKIGLWDLISRGF